MPVATRRSRAASHDDDDNSSRDDSLPQTQDFREPQPDNNEEEEEEEETNEEEDENKEPEEPLETQPEDEDNKLETVQEEEEEEEAKTEESADEANKTEETPRQEETKSEVNDQEEYDETPDKPPPNDETVELITDMMEWACVKGFEDREHRKQHYDSVEYFWSLHPMKKYNFGRLYTTVHLLRLLLGCCTEYPYWDLVVTEEGGGSQDENPDIRISPLVEWGRDLWQEVQDNLQEAYNLCRRRDVRHVFRFKLEEDQVAKLEQPEERDEDDLFRDKYFLLRKRMELQKILAPIREALERAVEDKKEPEISADELQEILEYTDNLEFPDLKDRVMRLFDVSPRGKVSLKPVEKLEKILTLRAFDLEHFQNKVQETLVSWKTAIMGEEAVLIQRGYTTGGPAMDYSKKSNPTRAELKELRKGRRALQQGHGDDPLEQSRKMAKKAVDKRAADDDDVDEEEMSPKLLPSSSSSSKKKKRKRGSAMYEKRASAVQLTFEDDDSSEDEPQGKRVKLSSTPEKRTPTKSKTKDTCYSPGGHAPTSPFPKTYNGPSPDPGVFDENGKVLKRRRWTNEEVQAIRMGVRRFGVGKWVEIKQAHGMVLRNRTGVQLKDKWRTMCERGEAELSDGDDSDSI